MDSKATQSFNSDTEFFWFLFKLIQANLLSFFKDKQSEATEFVKCVAKLHSESMCAELVPSNKKSKAPPPPPQLPKPANDAPTPDTLTNWTRPTEFYMFLYQLLLRNKSQFKSQMKQTDNFIAVITKMHAKCLNKEFTAAPLTTGAIPEKFKVIELAEQNAALEQEIASLKAQLALNTPEPTTPAVNGQNNGTLSKGASIKK